MHYRRGGKAFHRAVEAPKCILHNPRRYGQGPLEICTDRRVELHLRLATQEPGRVLPDRGIIVQRVYDILWPKASSSPQYSPRTCMLHTLLCGSRATDRGTAPEQSSQQEAYIFDATPSVSC